ncbi:uncharacterized protein LOC124929329 isoform X2 [Impatiens glandulifera]|uniref:uncharacterized protein LOC124929329 isoform X2 n=1 Tax=Impatiens glandulifera TaxID=253017 RepID=UPI001FB1966A|nr:uncharacterized protein LOC124929329 isoform X2 [Impatiens glandulifera]
MKKSSSYKVADASDCCIGSIVWVRRRNGSWWPGKILGSDGLSASHLMSPRSGTPVKLLGREDASVDWYNLEKSKRVKAFRCGEFDDCIQKVEASLGLPPKKREKYARREDAILHALELEKEMIEKKYVNMEPLCIETGCEISDDEKKKSILPSEKHLRSRSGSEKQDLTAEEPLDVKKAALGDRIDSKDEVTPRTRNRLALGFRTNPTKRKLASCFVADGSQKIEADDRNKCVDRGKKSLRRRDRCLSPVPERKKTREAASISAEDDTETDTVGTKSLGLETDEDSARLSDDVLDPISSRSSDIQWQHRSTNNNNNNEHADLASGGDETSILTPGCIGMSKWKLKGKRNSRARGGNNLSKVSFPRIGGESFGPEESDSHKYNRLQSVTAKTMLIDDDTEQDGGNHDDDTNDWEESNWNQFLPSYGDGEYYLEDHHRHQHPSSSSYLLDIDLKVVQAAKSSSYQRQHVPLISLLSKLNGHAIIGHPIVVEPLENGSSELLEEMNNFTVPPPPPPPRPRPTKKLSRKVQKKMRLSSSSLSSSQKIKTLSSIGVGLKREEEEGLMKGVGGLTGVACIPVKLVFSRLHEELVG